MLVLAIGLTDDQVHGEQEGAFFNTYYDGVCYAPLYIFCGKHLLVAKLRPSNVDPADGALEELKRVIELIHSLVAPIKIFLPQLTDACKLFPIRVKSRNCLFVRLQIILFPQLRNWINSPASFGIGLLSSLINTAQVELTYRSIFTLVIQLFP